MRTVADILFGLAGGQVHLDAGEGQPSELLDVQVYRWTAADDDPEADAIDSSAIEATSTSTTAAAGDGEDDPRVLELADVTGLSADRVYRLAGDESEDVEILEVLADRVIARHPLHNHYDAGATLESTRLIATLATAWLGDEANILSSSGPSPMYRVRWVYVVAGRKRVVDTYFNLVRYPGTHGVSPTNVDDLAPGFLNQLPTEHRSDQGRRLLEEAQRAVKFDLLGVDFDDAAIAEAEAVDELVRYKSIELQQWAALLAGGGDVTRHKAAEDKYTKRLNDIARIVARVPQRDQTTGAAAPPPAAKSLTER